MSWSVGKLPKKPTCQQQPVLRDPLNWLEQVVLEGQISTAWAHLKGKRIQSKHKRSFKKQGIQIQGPRKPNFRKPTALEGGSWGSSLYSKAQLLSHS